MAEELLVGEQLTPDMIESGATLVKALDKLNLSVKGAFWLLIPDEHVWRLMLALPEVRSIGPKAVYEKIGSVLERFPSNMASVGVKDISVVEEEMPLFQSLRAAMPTGPGISGVRLSRSVINGKLVEGAYLYRVA